MASGFEVCAKQVNVLVSIQCCVAMMSEIWFTVNHSKQDVRRKLALTFLAYICLVQNMAPCSSSLV